MNVAIDTETAINQGLPASRSSQGLDSVAMLLTFSTRHKQKMPIPVAQPRAADFNRIGNYECST